MKNQIRIISALALVAAFSACSSAQKKTTTPPAQASAANAAPTAASAKTEKPSPESARTLSCEKGKDQRSVKIETKGSGCEVQYTKFGQNKVVASSSNGTKHCEDSLAHIEKNLTSAGFTCR